MNKTYLLWFYYSFLVGSYIIIQWSTTLNKSLYYLLIYVFYPFIAESILVIQYKSINILQKDTIIALFKSIDKKMYTAWIGHNFFVTPISDTSWHATFNISGFMDFSMKWLKNATLRRSLAFQISMQEMLGT